MVATGHTCGSGTISWIPSSRSLSILSSRARLPSPPLELDELEPAIFTGSGLYSVSSGWLWSERVLVVQSMRDESE